MYRRISKGLVPAVLAAACLLAPTSALAATSTSTGTVSAGTLSLTTTAAPTFSATLNGTDLSPTYSVPATLNDATGSGAGWNTTITSTQFTTGGSTPQTLATTASTITGVTAVAAAGTTATAPTNGITYPLTVPAGATAPTAVKYFDAALNTGMGEFTLTPTVQVAIPANAYAGTYSSTLTLASVSGP
jgi:hypothetical protein